MDTKISSENPFALNIRWGANYNKSGTVFQLWAPSAKQVELVTADNESYDFLPMLKDEGGWWEITKKVRPDFAYGFRIDGAGIVPDPAAREQMSGVHGLSKLVDPNSYEWQTTHWKGRPWHEVVFYELHTGTFTTEGTFEGVIGKLDHLKRTGITAIELLPVAHFSGQRGWGYDGVLLYCPHSAYGGSQGLKRLVDAAHARGLMVFLDVVYNHFGPDGNYLHSYVPEFFHQDQHTPWGPAIAYDKAPVRDFMIQNAIFWLEEYRLDGLRLDAIDSIKDTIDPPLLKELVRCVRETITDRHVHITTEDDRNIAWHIDRAEDGSIPLVSGEWNDDFHHAAHVIATNEQESYYQDYETHSAEQMARALAKGFVFQGHYSKYRDKNVGTGSAHLPPTAFVHFIQNHDQIGNRAFGDRLRSLSSARAYDCIQAILLLSPQIPLMFQGDEFGDTNSFCFFTDFHGELGRAVSNGRKEEFRTFSAFEDERAIEVFPDPNDVTTFLNSKLDWTQIDRPTQRRRLQVTQELLDARLKKLVPLLESAKGACGSAVVNGRAFVVAWRLAEDKVYHLFANLDDSTWTILRDGHPNKIQRSYLVYSNHRDAFDELKQGAVPAWTVVFCLAKTSLLGAFDDG